MLPDGLSGLRKWGADAKIAASALRVLYEERDAFRNLKGPQFEAKQELKRFTAFYKFISEKKYAEFNGRIFWDMYVPSYPGPIFDRMMAANFWGIERSEESKFIATVDIAITDACMFRCEHCYASEALGKKNDITLENWLAIIDRFQEIGAGAFSFVGGEPLLRFDELCQVLERARGKSDLWMVATGFGLTYAKAEKLAQSGLTAAAVSLDHWDPDKHNTFRKSPKAFDEAAKAVALFNQAGVFPCMVVTATRDVIAEGGLEKYLELAKHLGAGIVEVFDPIAAGAYIGEPQARLTAEELNDMQDWQAKINTAPEYRHLPAVSTRATIEDSDAFGCGAGGNNFIHVDPSGNLVPCPMLSMSTGNIIEEGFDVPMKRMRELFPHATAHGPICPANALRDDILEAKVRTGNHMLPYEETKRLVSHFRNTKLPVL